jgi:hypothetical protein
VMLCPKNPKKRRSTLLSIQSLQPAFSNENGM